MCEVNEERWICKSVSCRVGVCKGCEREEVLYEVVVVDGNGVKVRDAGEMCLGCSERVCDNEEEKGGG